MRKKFLFFGATICVAVSALQGRAQSASAKQKPTVHVAPLRSAPPAEDPLQFGVSAEAALPLGDLKEVAKFGFGFNGLVKYHIADKLSLRGSIGYQTFVMKTVTYVDYDPTDPATYSIKPKAISAIPVRVGASYDLTENLFVQANVGVSFVNNHVGAALLYSPGIGYRFGSIEASLKYEAWSKNGTLSFAGLHVGYYF